MGLTTVMRALDSLIIGSGLASGFQVASHVTGGGDPNGPDSSSGHPEAHAVQDVKDPINSTPIYKT